MTFIRDGKVPPEPPNWLTRNGYSSPGLRNYSSYWEARRECTEHGMWAIVDLNWTKVLAGWIGGRKVLEIMAGRGWLAKALAFHGTSITVTDNYGWAAKHDKTKNVHPVIRLKAENAIRKYADAEVLIVSWPPCNGHEIIRVAEIWGRGRPLVYIGEGGGGCNAPEGFFEHFKELDNDHPDIPLYSWDGIHDHVWIGHWT